jgi:hypothetical protein
MIAQTLVTQLQQALAQPVNEEAAPSKSSNDLISQLQQALALPVNEESASTSSSPAPSQVSAERKSKPEGKHECPVCKKKFSRRWYVYGAHMRTHSKSILT